MQDQERSGNDGEDQQQGQTRKNVDVPANQSVSHSALMCCDFCLSKPQDDVNWRSYVAKYNVPLEVRHDVPHDKVKVHAISSFPMKLERLYGF